MFNLFKSSDFLKIIEILMVNIIVKKIINENNNQGMYEFEFSKNCSKNIFIFLSIIYLLELQLIPIVYQQK